MHPLAPHHRELARPEGVPERIVGGFRNPSVESDLDELPGLSLTDSGSEGGNIVIGVGIPEGFSGGVEEVLPVNEGDSSFGGGHRRHGDSRKK